MIRPVLIVKALGCYDGTLLGLRQLLPSPLPLGHIPYGDSVSEGNPALSQGTDAVRDDRNCPFGQHMMDTMVVFD